MGGIAVHQVSRSVADPSYRMKRLQHACMMTRESPASRPAEGDASSAAAWWTFAAIAAVLLPLMILASTSFGVTWDEKARHKYGELILEFFNGQRSRASVADDGGQLYGGLFDVLCV